MEIHRPVRILLTLGAVAWIGFGATGCSDKNADSQSETTETAAAVTPDPSSSSTSTPKATETATPPPPPAAVDPDALSQDRFLEMVEDGSELLLLDVRTQGEFAGGHISGATNISHTELKSRLGELGAYKDGNVVVYCASGIRTRVAISMLKEAGFAQVFHLEGDMAGWRRSGHPVE